MIEDKIQDYNSNEYPKYEKIAKEIALKIFNDEFDVTEPLPNESAMQETFNVGRSIIRDSLKHLKSKGLIVTKTKVGTIICPMSEWNYLDSQLIEWLMEAPIKDKVHNYFFALRKLIEPEVSCLSALLLSDEQLDNLSDIWNIMEELDKNFDHAKWVETDLKFHEIIYKGSKNLLFIAFFEIYKVVWLSKLSTVANYCDVCYQRHKAIYTAIRERNPRKSKYSSIMLLKHSATNNH